MPLSVHIPTPRPSRESLVKRLRIPKARQKELLAIMREEEAGPPIQSHQDDLELDKLNRTARCGGQSGILTDEELALLKRVKKPLTTLRDKKLEALLILRAGDLELDRLDHTARRAGQSIILTNKEFALLEHLMLNRGRCVSRVELLDSVWNLEPAQTINIVDVYVNYIRRKLKDPSPGKLIREVRGKGYMVPLETELVLPAVPTLALSAIKPATTSPTKDAISESAIESGKKL